MVTEFKNGQMVLFIKGCGWLTKLVVMENFIMLMEMSMMESGKMIEQMDKVYIHILTALNIMVTGKMIYKMV